MLFTQRLSPLRSKWATTVLYRSVHRTNAPTSSSSSFWESMGDGSKKIRFRLFSVLYVELGRESVGWASWGVSYRERCPAIFMGGLRSYGGGLGKKRKRSPTMTAGHRMALGGSAGRGRGHGRVGKAHHRSSNIGSGAATVALRATCSRITHTPEARL